MVGTNRLVSSIFDYPRHRPATPATPAAPTVDWSASRASALYVRVRLNVSRVAMGMMGLPNERVKRKSTSLTPNRKYFHKSCVRTYAFTYNIKSSLVYVVCLALHEQVNG